ncbi:hypothetical protein Agub_g4833, partial [Astrephomene gubernaculifera]
VGGEEEGQEAPSRVVSSSSISSHSSGGGRGNSAVAAAAGGTSSARSSSSSSGSPAAARPAPSGSQSPPSPAAASPAGSNVVHASSSNNNSGASGEAAPAPGSPPPPAAPPLPPAASRTLRLLLSQVFSRLEGLSGVELANVLSALAVLRYGDKVVSEQLLQAASLKLIDCRPQELSHVMCSAALLSLPPAPEVRSAFYAAVRAQLRRFGPRELALTMWAYGAIGTDVQEDAVQ